MDAYGAGFTGTRAYLPVQQVLKRAIIEAAVSQTFAPTFHKRSEQLPLAAQIADYCEAADFEPYRDTAHAMVHEDVLPALERHRYLGPLHERVTATDFTAFREFMPSTGLAFHPHITISKRLADAEDWKVFLAYWIE